jgi:hypothetical protein
MSAMPPTDYTRARSWRELSKKVELATTRATCAARSDSRAERASLSSRDRARR